MTTAVLATGIIFLNIFANVNCFNSTYCTLFNISLIHMEAQHFFICLFFCTLSPYELCLFIGLITLLMYIEVASLDINPLSYLIPTSFPQIVVSFFIWLIFIL